MTMTPPPGNALPAPDPAAAAHSRRLAERIAAECRAAGPGGIPFRRFMELALYAPGLGYYRTGTRKFGPGGDFITAPELSPLFARCLARQCADVLEHLGGGGILELGAGSGIMAAELLLELQALDALPAVYAILELSGELRQRQRDTLEERAPELLERVRWLDALPEPGFRGVMLGNEVLDALPVERFRIGRRGALPLHVTWDGTGFAWTQGPQDPALGAALEAIQKDLDRPLPTGYESEYSPTLAPWLAALAARLAAGVLLLVDYGYPRREYYHPQRAAGTLLCHYRHRAHADPLLWPGLQDITASVDFTAVAEAALTAGLTVAGYTTQAYFLFGCGLQELVAGADPRYTARYAELTRQVKLLTLPGEMGERCKAIALSRAMDAPLRGFRFLDQRQHL